MNGLCSPKPFLAVAVALAVSGVGFGQESIRLKNGMNSPITVLLQSEQQTSPTEVKIRVDETREYKLKWDGQYTIQVIPDDRPDTGYHLGNYNLKALSGILGKHPLELKGDFLPGVDARGRRVGDVRVAVHFDVYVPSEGKINRHSAPEHNYAIGGGLGLGGIDVKPTASTAVLQLVVPASAKVSIDGELKPGAGELRVFQINPLAHGKAFTHKIKIEWDRDGHACEETREVEVRGGETTRVYFKLFDPRPLVVLVPVVGGR